MSASPRRRGPAVFLIALLVAASAARAMDQVRAQTHADEAAAKYGLSGAGVTVAILDRGIDWSHPDFLRPDGKTRIRWLLDMTGQDLCNGGPAAVEYSAAQIDAALAGGAPVASRDAVGHGTVTAGIAAGDGSAAAGGKYRGMAPQADLVIVKLTSEGAPAHDGEPAETAFQGCLDEALDWLDAKLTGLGQPAVALINSGTQWGPVDGTSAVSRKLDLLFGSGRPGRAYVAASGDEGAMSNHAGGSFDSTADTVVRITKSSDETSYMQMWLSAAPSATVTITFDDGTVVGPVGPGGFLNQSGVYIVRYAPGQEFYPWQSTSGDRAVWVRITGHSGGGSVRLRGTAAGTGRFDLYGDASGVSRFDLYASTVAFEDHLVAGRLTDYSATRSAVVAGAHVARTAYTDLDGIPREVLGEGSTGELWLGSSGGPTRDGRLHGVDVTAPGQSCFAAYAGRSYWGTFRFNLVQDGGGWYGRAGATSGAAPIVVGAAALLLQLQPSLTAAQLRQVLRDTAVSDGFTGATPSASWGFGKLDVLRAADAVRALPVPVFGWMSWLSILGVVAVLAATVIGRRGRPRIATGPREVA